MRTTDPITYRRQETWLAATEAGLTTAEIAQASGVTPRYVQRLVQKARATRSLESASSPCGETPILALCSSPNPKPLACSHTRQSTTCGEWYCLDCDMSSLDGGRTWVLVANRQGTDLRRHRLQEPPLDPPADPPRIGGMPANSTLKGGRG